MKALVVGAGPCGAEIARRLAEDGHSVELFEEHAMVGRPIACTGIVTKALFEFVPKDESYIINELKAVRIFSPSGKTLEVPLQEYVICREKFDTWMVERAKDAGVKVHLRHKFVDANDKITKFRLDEKIVEREYDILIGADGPFSAVARSQGLLNGRQYYIGSQATVRGDFEPDVFLTFFGKCAPGFFAWAVPEGNNFSRVGVASKKKVHVFFDMLRERFNGEIVERQAGPIPIYDGARQVQRNNVYLVGDAAGVVKNTTGGGIITGIWSAKILANALKENRNYSKLLRPLRKELWLHKKVRETLDRFSDDDYERLVKYMSSDRVKRILEKYPREYPSKFLWRLLIAEPRFVTFARHLL